MMKKQTKWYLLLWLLMPLIAGCQQTSSDSSLSSSSSISEVNVPVESVNITSEKTTLKVGESVQLNLTVLPSNATNKSVTYQASSSVISVNQSGLVQALSEGQASVTVTSTDGNKTDELSFLIVPAGEYSYLNVADYATAMMSTPYQIAGISGQDKYGLNQGALVGINEALNVEAYPMKADSEFAVNQRIVVDAITLETIQNYFPSASSVSDYYRFQTALHLAKALNDNELEAKIILPNRVMEVYSDGILTAHIFQASGLNGTYIAGNDTIFNLHFVQLNWKGFINLQQSNKVYFHNIKIRHQIPASLTGTIVAASEENKQISIAVPSEFNPLVQALISNPKALRSWVEFDVNTKAPLQGGNFVVDGFNNYVISGDVTSGYTIQTNFKNAINRSRNGSYVAMQFAQYDANGIAISQSSNIYLENVIMHHAAGMGLVSSQTTNLYLNRFQLTLDSSSSSLMTATADAIHFNSMHGDVFIRNSVIENSHDDALNLKHGYWYKVTDAVGGSTKTITVARITSAVETPKIGDKIAIYHESSFEGRNPTNGYYTIHSVTPTSTGWTFGVNERMANVSEWGVCRATFISDTPRFEFTNNLIQNKRNRGILVQVPNALIENNTFRNIGHGSIQAASAMDQYNEATIPQEIVIRNNKFINNCYIKPEPLYGDIAIFAIANNASVGPDGTIHGALIENNFIARNGNAAISLRGVGDSNINHNLFYDVSRTQPSGETFKTILHLYNGGNITLDGNYNYDTRQDGLNGVVLQGKTNPETIHILDTNYDIEFQKNEDAGPIVEVSKATNAITIDGQLADWENNNVHQVVIDGISDAEGNVKTATELQSHFKVNKLMLSHDDLGIYIAFDIFDDKLDVRTINDFWLGDCVELFVSSVTNMPNADLMVIKEDGGVIQAAFAPGWESSGYFTFAGVRTNSAYMTKQSLMQVSVIVTSQGYAGEVLIPFTMAPELLETINAGKPIDMAIIVADAERTDIGLKRIQVGNVPHFVEDYKTKTARMPQYFFK